MHSFKRSLAVMGVAAPSHLRPRKTRFECKLSPLKPRPENAR